MYKARIPHLKNVDDDNIQPESSKEQSGSWIGV